MFLGLRTVIYPARDIAASKSWFTEVLGFGPYFDEPFYVGYNVGGYELGLLPNAGPDATSSTYWGVSNLDEAMAAVTEAGCTIDEDAREVGDGIKVATIIEPGGNKLGLIENPHFKLPS